MSEQLNRPASWVRSIGVPCLIAAALTYLSLLGQKRTSAVRMSMR